MGKHLVQYLGIPRVQSWEPKMDCHLEKLMVLQMVQQTVLHWELKMAPKMAEH